MIGIFETKFVIANKRYRREVDCDYIHTLAHDFAGKKDVIGYLELKDALHYDTRESAELVLQNQPLWVREKHTVVPFTDFGWYCQIDRSERNKSL